MGGGISAIGDRRLAGSDRSLAQRLSVEAGRRVLHDLSEAAHARVPADGGKRRHVGWLAVMAYQTI